MGVLVGSAVLLTGAAAPAHPEQRPEPASPAPAFLTLLFSRAQISTATQCRPTPGAVSLFQVADELRRRGLTGTATLVPARTQERSRTCYDDLDVNGNVLRPRAVLYGSWADAAGLRNVFGWTFVSHGQNYLNLRQLTADQQREESCGSLAAFRARGHLRADGLFAYPNNFYTSEIQSNVVAGCFAFGRTYAATVNERSTMRSPFLQKTISVNGGRCNDPTLPCATFVAPRQYSSPALLRARLSTLREDQWLVVQTYRFVRGASAGRWDCTAPDWRAHWTSSAEEYCWNDFLSVLDGKNSATEVVDPLTVAVAWGRR